LPSVDEIAEIAENETEENAILIAQTEISFLENLSIEGDVPEDVSGMNYKIDVNICSETTSIDLVELTMYKIAKKWFYSKISSFYWIIKF
jgi:hypothetical protein